MRNVAYNFIMDVVEKDWKTAFKNLWKDFTQRALQAFADIATIGHLLVDHLSA